MTYIFSYLVGLPKKIKARRKEIIFLLDFLIPPLPFPFFKRTTVLFIVTDMKRKRQKEKQINQSCKSLRSPLLSIRKKIQVKATHTDTAQRAEDPFLYSQWVSHPDQLSRIQKKQKITYYNLYVQPPQHGQIILPCPSLITAGNFKLLPDQSTVQKGTEFKFKLHNVVNCIRLRIRRCHKILRERNDQICYCR